MTDPSRPALVLDTNVVLDWLAFDDAAMQLVAAAIAARELRLVSSAACVEELQRALAYKAIGLDAAAQARALATYRSCAVMLEVPPDCASIALPRCDDPDDQKFLELACHAGARWLLTRDKALLRLAGKMKRLTGLAVIAPERFNPAAAGSSAE